MHRMCSCVFEIRIRCTILDLFWAWAMKIDTNIFVEQNRYTWKKAYWTGLSCTIFQAVLSNEDLTEQTWIHIWKPSTWLIGICGGQKTNKESNTWHMRAPLKSSVGLTRSVTGQSCMLRRHFRQWLSVETSKTIQQLTRTQSSQLVLKELYLLKTTNSTNSFWRFFLHVSLSLFLQTRNYLAEAGKASYSRCPPSSSRLWPRCPSGNAHSPGRKPS